MFNAKRRKKTPRELAVQRLRTTLSADRMFLSPRKIEQLKADLRADLARQLNVEEQYVEIYTEPKRGHFRLRADVTMKQTNSSN